MMQQLSIPRIGLLLRQYFIENYQRELLQWLIIAMVFMFIQSTGLATVIFYIRGVIFAGNFFAFWQSQAKASHFLMVPATVLEKTIVGLLLVIPYYIIMFGLSYYVGAVLHIGLMLLLRATSISLFSGWVPTAFPFRALYTEVLDSSSRLISLQSVFVLGSAFFRRYAIPKTLLSLLGISFGITILLIIVTVIVGAQLFNSVTPERFVQIQLWADSTQTLLGYGMQILFALGLWVGTYVVLARKQV